MIVRTLRTTPFPQRKMCKARDVNYTCNHTFGFRLSTCLGTFTKPRSALSSSSTDEKVACRARPTLWMKSDQACGPCQRAACGAVLDGAGASLPDEFELMRRFPGARLEPLTKPTMAFRVGAAVRHEGSLLRREVKAEEVVGSGWWEGEEGERYEGWGDGTGSTLEEELVDAEANDVDEVFWNKWSTTESADDALEQEMRSADAGDPIAAFWREHNASLDAPAQETGGPSSTARAEYEAASGAVATDAAPWGLQDTARDAAIAPASQALHHVATLHDLSVPPPPAINDRVPNPDAASALPLPSQTSPSDRPSHEINHTPLTHAGAHKPALFNVAYLESILAGGDEEATGIHILASALRTMDRISASPLPDPSAENKRPATAFTTPVRPRPAIETPWVPRRKVS